MELDVETLCGAGYDVKSAERANNRNGYRDRQWDTRAGGIELKTHITNPLERLNAEIKRRTDVVGIFPNEAAITRLIGALLLEQNDEWQLQRRYMQLEGLQQLADNQPARLSAVIS